MKISSFSGFTSIQTYRDIKLGNPWFNFFCNASGKALIFVDIMVEYSFKIYTRNRLFLSNAELFQIFVLNNIDEPQLSMINLILISIFCYLAPSFQVSPDDNVKVYVLYLHGLDASEFCITWLDILIKRLIQL